MTPTGDGARMILKPTSIRESARFSASNGAAAIEHEIRKHRSDRVRMREVGHSVTRRS